MTKINTLAAVVSMGESASRARPGGRGFTVTRVSGKINDPVPSARQHPRAEILYEESYWNLRIRKYCGMLQFQQKPKVFFFNTGYGIKCDAIRNHYDSIIHLYCR